MMKKFRFDSLLKIRENIRDEKKMALEILLNAQSELHKKIDNQNRFICQHIDRWKQEQKGTVLPELLIQFRNHLEHLKSVQKKLQQQLNDLNAEIEGKRIELNEANQDVKVLENLREKINEKNQEKTKRLEQKELDEMASHFSNNPAE
ncbi:MAG: flagellar export protein FliJ [Planctomycetia bacterium]|nr:flagellar export protein FliJ [Planctomycetia bacterium]